MMIRNKRKPQKRTANFDMIYCVSKECKDRCWRHISNYKFEPGGFYWYQENCERMRNKQ